MIIVSRKNEKIVAIAKQVKEQSLVCLDTPKLIDEAKQGSFSAVFVLSTNAENEKIAKEFGAEFTQVSESVIAMFSSLKTPNDLIVIGKINVGNLEYKNENTLVLDDVQDPGNVGTLVRSACGAGFNRIISINGASFFNDKVVRASMGAIFKTKLMTADKKSFIDFTKENKLNLCACDMKGESIFKQKAFPPPIFLVVGNEGSGIDAEIKKLCTKTYQIPMQNNLESLNVAVSGSIIMYQITKGEQI